jgi:hypothetical protein
MYKGGIVKNTVAIVIICTLISGSINLLEAKKSTALALGLSVGVPTLGWWAGDQLNSLPLSLVAITIGPSAGHFYAEQVITALISLPRISNPVFTLYD